MIKSALHTLSDYLKKVSHNPKLLSFGIFFFIVLGLIVRVWIVRDYPFENWDEGIYAEVSSQFIENKSLQGRFNGELWFNKPLLSHYLVALSFLTFSDPELGARLVMVTIGALLFAFLYFLTRKVMTYYFDDDIKKMNPYERELMFAIPMMITASAPMMVSRSARLNTDGVLALFWVMYFWGMHSYKWRLVSVTLGTWFKSLLGYYPVAFELLRFNKKTLTKKNIVQFLSLILVPSTWFLYMYVKYGQVFVQSHLFDQVIKRVTDPIELHFGGKLYYSEIAFKQFGIFLVLFACAYFIIILDHLSIHRKNIFNFTSHMKAFQKLYTSEKWPYLLTLLSALPFFAFLNIVQSKISWYFASVAPLFTIVVPYLYMRMSKKWIRILLILLVVLTFYARFIPITFALDVEKLPLDSRIKQALCVKDIEGDSISVLVSIQERDIRNVLEATKQQTATSFMYGGSPSFVYYINKDVHYFYKSTEFVDELRKESGDKDPLVLVQEYDVNNDEARIDKALEGYDLLEDCRIDDWRVYRK